MGALLSCLRADADVEERYVPVKRVGSGAEADVWLARERCSGSLFALKLVKRGMAAWQARCARAYCRHACGPRGSGAMCAAPTGRFRLSRAGPL